MNKTAKDILKAVSQSVNKTMKTADRIDTRCPTCGQDVPDDTEQQEQNDNSADKSGDKE